MHTDAWGIWVGTVIYHKPSYVKILWTSPVNGVQQRMQTIDWRAMDVKFRSFRPGSIWTTPDGIKYLVLRNVKERILVMYLEKCHQQAGSIHEWSTSAVYLEEDKILIDWYK